MESKGPRNFFVPWQICFDPKVDFAHCFGMFFWCSGFQVGCSASTAFSSGVVSLVIHPVVSFVLGKWQVGNMIVDLWSTY